MAAQGMIDIMLRVYLDEALLTKGQLRSTFVRVMIDIMFRACLGKSLFRSRSINYNALGMLI